MTPGRGSRLSFMNPLSDERATRLVAELAEAGPATVLDVGCGWGELMLRLLDAVPTAHGTGVDSHAPDVARGRATAETRGLTDRATFVEADAAGHLTSADVIISIGAYHALGSIDEALQLFRTHLNPGGTLLFAAEFWEQPPPADRLAHMWPGATVDDCTDLPTLVDRTIAAGFRPLHIQTSSTGEWEEFESGLAADSESWLADHPDDPAAADLRTKLDTQRRMWLNGHRGYLGFAFLTLKPVRAATL